LAREPRRDPDSARSPTQEALNRNLLRSQTTITQAKLGVGTPSALSRGPCHSCRPNGAGQQGCQWQSAIDRMLATTTTHKTSTLRRKAMKAAAAKRP